MSSLPDMNSHSGGGGGGLLSLICPELGVAPLLDPGTDLGDELPSPADSPAAADQGVAPPSADMDINLEQVFGDVGSLPAMVTPVCEFDGSIVAQPLMVTSPAGPTVMSPGFLHPLTGSVGCSSVPAVSTQEKCLLLKAAETTQGQPWAGPSFGGESAGSHFSCGSPGPSSGSCVSSRW